MKPIIIESADDPRIAPYTQIRERDLVGRQGLFIAEGKVVLNVLFTTPLFRPVSAFVLHSRLEGMKETLAKADDDMPVYVTSREVMDKVAGFPMHRGILALGKRTEHDTMTENTRSHNENSIVLALVGIANHDNMGAIFRNAAAFGVDAIMLDPTCCDPLYRKSIRVSVGAALKVPFVRFESTDDMIGSLESQNYRIMALSPAGRHSLGEISSGGKIALLLGTEGEGLPKKILERLQTLRIPMREDFDSLNVATAGAIALSHFYDS